MRWLGWLRRSPGRYEDSRALRIAVLVTTLWGYVSLGLVAGLLPIAVLAAVVTCAGHWSSWRQRGPKSFLRLLILSLALCAVVGWGLVQLTTGLGGGRLPQAQIGLLVQAVTSFDLRTRRNAYATVLHSLAIMYLASNFGFSMLFGLLLLGFAGCLTAVLVVATLEDKRRVSRPFRLTEAAGGWVFWSIFGAASLALTAVFTILLPRPGGGQLFNPLTLTLPFQAAGQPELVEPLVPFIQINAGGGSRGLGPTVDLRFRGQFNESVAFYVRSPLSSYWRGLAFDQYTGQDWASTTRQTPASRDRRGRYEVGDGWSEGSDRTYVQTFYIMRDQSEAVPVGYEAQTLLFRDEAPRLSVGDDRSIRRSDPLRAGSSYTVLSTAPSSFGPYAASYSGGFNVDDPDRYLEVPDRRSPVAALASRITEGQRGRLGKATAIERYLRDNYPYRLDIPPLPEGVDAVEHFLFYDQAGFCTQFASAMVMMLRYEGIPARLVTGFGPGEYNTFSGLYTVRASDAHAWVEAWVPRLGWVSFDPTPRYEGFGEERPTGMWSSTLLDRPFVSAVQGLVGVGALSLGAGISALLVPMVAGLAVGLLIAGLLLVYRARLWRRSRRPSSVGDDRRRAILLAYRQAVRRVEPVAGARRPSQTPAEYLAQTGRLPDERAGVFAELTRLAEQAAYDPREPELPAATRARACLAELRRPHRR